MSRLGRCRACMAASRTAVVTTSADGSARLAGSIMPSTSATARAEPGRSFGSLASRCMIRLSSPGARPHAWRTATARVRRHRQQRVHGVVPFEGMLARAQRYRRVPRLNRSLWKVAGRPRACSGDMYAGVPRMAPCRVNSESSPALRARPKSRIFTRPVPASSQVLECFTSRCTNPLACAAPSPSAISRPMRSTSDIGSDRTRRMRTSSVSPLRNGMTR